MSDNEPILPPILGKSAYHHGELRAALLQAALAMLEEGTAPGTLSLREAARRAGVSAMAPYRHFTDRDALLDAVAAIGFDRLAACQRAADTSRCDQDALRAQGVAYVAFACANPALFRLMFGSGAPGLSRSGKSEELARASGDSFDILARRAARTGRGPADGTSPQDAAIAHWALVHGLAMLAIDGTLAWCTDNPVALAERITARFVGLSST